MRDLATASHQKLRREAAEEMSLDKPVKEVVRSSVRKSTTVEVSLPDTPTKSSAKGKQKATEAFENAMNQRTPTKAKPVVRETPVKAQIDYSKPFEALKDDADATNKPEAEEIPYETYWGDMLIRYQRKEDLDARQKKMEVWRQGMLQRLRASV